MGNDVVETYSYALQELHGDYIRVWEAIDRITYNIGLIQSIRFQLTEQQKEDIQMSHKAILAKVEILVSQIESYGDFILEDSEHTGLVRMQASILVDKVNKLTKIVQQVIQ